MKERAGFTKWLKECELHQFIAAWAVIGLLTALLALSRLSYSVDTQAVYSGGYSFKGEAKKDGIHYTVVSAPEG